MPKNLATTLRVSQSNQKVRDTFDFYEISYHFDQIEHIDQVDQVDQSGRSEKNDQSDQTQYCQASGSV